MDMVNRFFQDTNQSFFLFGPLGTGKSTWVKQHLKTALYIDLLAPEVYRPYSARPERLREVAEAQTCLLYRGKERIKIKNVLCIPCEEFLKNLIPQRPIRL